MSKLANQLNKAKEARNQALEQSIPTPSKIELTDKKSTLPSIPVPSIEHSPSLQLNKNNQNRTKRTLFSFEMTSELRDLIQDKIRADFLKQCKANPKAKLKESTIKDYIVGLIESDCNKQP